MVDNIALYLRYSVINARVIEMKDFSKVTRLEVNKWDFPLWNEKLNHKMLDLKGTGRTSLVVQWLITHLPVQQTLAWSLVREDSTCCGATKPVRHNFWASVPQLLKPAHNKRSPHAKTKSNPASLQLEKARAKQQRTSAATNKYITYQLCDQCLLSRKSAPTQPRYHSLSAAWSEAVRCLISA